MTETPAKKRICCFLDGTWNNALSSTDDSANTNIWRLAQAVERQSGGMANVIYYATGIGSDASTLGEVPSDQKSLLGKIDGIFNKFVESIATHTEAMIQGATGLGIVEKIQEAYAFVAANYNDGDEIVIYGFSRGAYTARQLAAFILGVGLLSRDDMEELAELMAFFQTLSATETALTADPHDPVLKAVLDRQRAKQKRQPVTIRFLGVFDTVGALGIPGKFVLPGQLDYLGFSDTDLSDHVITARHAMALNENRKDFDITRWTHPKGKPHKDCKQVWFAGNHGDVGGGWSEIDLAQIPLFWMVQETEDAIGLRFDKAYLLGRVFTNAPYGALRPHDAITQGSAYNALSRAMVRRVDAANGETVHASVGAQDVAQWPAAAADLKAAVAAQLPQAAPLGQTEQLLKDKWSTLAKGLPKGATATLAVGSFANELRAGLHDAVYLLGGKQERNVAS